jgi:subtilisin family serine protease
MGLSAIEALEPRCLLSNEPWGPYARLIDQDAAANSFPTITGAGQTIAVLDTCAKYTMSQLGGGIGAGYKIVDGYDFVNNDSNPMDVDGHGTATSSIIAGERYIYNGAAYRGVAPDANLVVLRIDDGSENIPDARYQAALQWVINHRAQYNIVAVNISEGGNIIYNAKTTAGSIYSDELATLKAAEDESARLSLAIGQRADTERAQRDALDAQRAELTELRVTAARVE